MDILSSEFFQDKSLPLEDYKEAFCKRFPDGKIELVVEDVPGRPNHRFINTLVPLDQKEEYEKFNREYAKSRGFTLECHPRTTFPRGNE